MVELRSITKRYGSVAVLTGFDLTVPAGESLVLVGPSGCGKTTLLRLIAGLEYPTAGEVILRGEVVSSPARVLPPHRRGVGFVFQSPALWPHMTVAQHLRFGLDDLPRAEVQARLAELLEQTALTALAERYPHQLSGGQARRVGLARALAPRPDLLLLDEPLTNLHADLKAELLALIKQTTRALGTTMIYVTHDESEAAQVANRVLRLGDTDAPYTEEP